MFFIRSDARCHIGFMTGVKRTFVLRECLAIFRTLSERGFMKLYSIVIHYYHRGKKTTKKMTYFKVLLILRNSVLPRFKRSQFLLHNTTPNYITRVWYKNGNGYVTLETSKDIWWNCSLIQYYDFECVFFLLLLFFFVRLFRSMHFSCLVLLHEVSINFKYSGYS